MRFLPSENAESLEVLTPAHFLKGSSCTKFPEPDITLLREGRLSRWQRVTQMQQHFWKRWSSEYLSLLDGHQGWKHSFAEGGQRSTLEMAAWVHLGSHTRRGRGHPSSYGQYSYGSDQESHRQTSRSAHRFRDCWNLTSSNGRSMFGADRQRLVMRA